MTFKEHNTFIPIKNAMLFINNPNRPSCQFKVIYKPNPEDYKEGKRYGLTYEHAIEKFSMLNEGYRSCLSFEEELTFPEVFSISLGGFFRFYRNDEGDISFTSSDMCGFLYEMGKVEGSDIARLLRKRSFGADGDYDMSYEQYVALVWSKEYDTIILN